MIIFDLDKSGKAAFYPYGITDGEKIVPCKSEAQAERLLKNSRYEGGYAVINSDEPSEKLLETLKGVRFDSREDAELFINGGGYKESATIKIASLEEEMTNTQLALCEVYEMML